MSLEPSVYQLRLCIWTAVRRVVSKRYQT